MDGQADNPAGKAPREPKSLEWALKVGEQRRSRAFYRTVRALIRVFLWRWLRTRHRGSENIPPTGPVIIAPVHRSNLDAPLFSVCTERQLRALAKESLFVNPLGAWICAALGSIPLRRGEADRDAMRAARTLLDSGAMADCSAQWLHQFARLGSAYSRIRFGVAAPRVGLLSIGEEPEKGNLLVKETHKLLAADDEIDFFGNIEGRDVLDGPVDVVVTDGFTGNVLLKSLEGTASFFVRLILERLADGGQAGAVPGRQSLEGGQRIGHADAHRSCGYGVSVDSPEYGGGVVGIQEACGSASDSRPKIGMAVGPGARQGNE